MSLQIIVFLVFVAGLIVFQRLNNRGIAQIDAESARGMLKDRDTVILDVRTRPEFQSGHIKDAIPIPIAEIDGRIGSLALDKDHQVLVYCLSGNRSMTASRMLRRNGFNRVANLKGGMNAWKANGFTVLKGN